MANKKDKTVSTYQRTLMTFVQEAESCCYTILTQYACKCNPRFTEEPPIDEKNVMCDGG